MRLLANLVGRDAGAVTGQNLLNIEEEFGLDPWVSSSAQLGEKYCQYTVPDEERWRLPLLVKLLVKKRDMAVKEEKTNAISELIDSLCYS